MKYEKPTIEVIELDAKDIVCDSFGGLGGSGNHDNDNTFS